MVTQEELERLLKPHGWYLRMERRHNSFFAYAKRRAGGTVVSRYLAAANRFSDLTEETVLEKISCSACDVCSSPVSPAQLKPDEQPQG